ncbi:hypothetical protein JL721_1278 [Aureococcus anophagefferens]|nr:hypothetical protein JL721_1278 [Aureococcus anophagefferens]
MIHEERPNSRGLGSLVKLSSDLKVDSPDVAEETRTELLEKLRLDSTRRAHLLEQHRAESNMEDSRRHSRIHKRPGYEAMRERHEHLKDVDEWFRSLDVDHTNTVDAHELIGPFTVLGMAKTRTDPEELRSRASAAVKPKKAPSTSGDKAAAKRAEELRLHELDLRTQILMNRRGQVMEALMAHATTSTEPDVKRCRELQGTLRTLVLGGSGRPAKLVFGGGEKYVSRYATSKSAVNVGGKLEKQDDKRKELFLRESGHDAGRGRGARKDPRRRSSSTR